VWRQIGGPSTQPRPEPPETQGRACSERLQRHRLSNHGLCALSDQAEETISRLFLGPKSSNTQLTRALRTTQQTLAPTRATLSDYLQHALLAHAQKAHSRVRSPHYTGQETADADVNRSCGRCLPPADGLRDPGHRILCWRPERNACRHRHQHHPLRHRHLPPTVALVAVRHWRRAH
jgi:hypothetical protein